MQITRKAPVIEVLTMLMLFITLAITANCAIAPQEKIMKTGDSIIMGGINISRVAIADPAVADVAVLSTAEVLLNAKGAGKTTLYIWDKQGRHDFTVTVRAPQADIARICARIAQQIDDARIQVRALGDVVILDGTVAREQDAARAESIAKLVVDSALLPEVLPETTPGGLRIDTVIAPVDPFPVPSAQDTVPESPGIPKPKISNLIRIEKPFDYVSAHTMQVALGLRQALKGTNHLVRALPGGIVVIEGKVGTQAALDSVNQLAKAWDGQSVSAKGTAAQVGEGTEKITIVNSVQMDASVAQQIMVRAQVVDIDRLAMKDFGVDWGRVTFSQSTVPGVVNASIQDQPFLVGQSNFGPFDLFGGGAFKRFDPIGARIKALEQQNKAKVLSEPNLLVLDGREASMLVGGEIPIPIVQSAQIGSAASVTVEYKEFGVRLKILPTITSQNTLQLRIQPEVSSLDFTNAVQFSGFLIPALKTRRADTTVDLKDGQSLIIGGLIQNSTSKLVKQIPVLGNIPILGELFKTRSFQKEETELVIIVTPQIMNPTANAVAPIAPGTPALPALPTQPGQ